MATRGFLFILLTLAFLQAHGQEVEEADSLAAPVDSVLMKNGKRYITIESYEKRFDPRRALMLSATFPGWGQIYNKKYWKLPLVYGGFAAGIYVIDHYQGMYVNFKNELFTMLNDPTMTTSPEGYTEDQLRNIITTSRRQRDFFCIITGIWYMIQIVDAHVDAHLKAFDLNPQLHVKLEPAIENNLMTGRTTGLSLIIKF